MRRLPPRQHLARRSLGVTASPRKAAARQPNVAVTAGTASTTTPQDHTGTGLPGTPGSPVPQQPAYTSQITHAPGFAVTGGSGPPSQPPPQLEPGEYLTLVMADFQGLYQVNVAAASERLTLVRFALSLLAAPFAATIALVSAKVVTPAMLESWTRLPVYLFALLAAFGLLAIVPYLRMIEASLTHERTARGLNNFRLLYSRGLHAEFLASGWTPNLPVDPTYPESFAPLSWPGINVIVLATLDASYITVGVAGLARVRPAPLLIAFGIVAVTLLLFSVYYVRTNVSRRRKEPASPLGVSWAQTWYPGPATASRDTGSGPRSRGEPRLGRCAG
jgi:hypothetical protein